MQTTNLPAIAVDGDVIPVTPIPEHEYVVPTALVAQGYGVTQDTIRKHLQRHADELVEGKHWLPSVTNSHARNLQVKSTLWTKRGIVRLGFFIRSERAKQFRDLAEDLVVGQKPDVRSRISGGGDMSGLVTQLCGMIRGLGDRVAELERDLLPIQVEHRLVMREWVSKKGARPNDRGRGLPQHRTGRKVTKGLDFWLLAHYKRDGETRTRSRDVYEQYRQDNPKATETPGDVNRAIARLFKLEKRRWHGRFYQEVGFIGLRAL